MTITSRLIQALTLVKAFETFHAHAAPQGEGGFVIGYGHTASAREGAVVSRDEAEALLIYDLGEIGQLIDAWVYAPLHDNQRQALIAFGFHIGALNLHRSTAMRRLNSGDYMGCAREIERWRMAELAGRGQVVDVLVRRRAAEKALFLTPPDGFPKAAGARLQPRFDGDRAAPATVEAEGPVETAVETTAAMSAADNVAARLRALVPDPQVESAAQDAGAKQAEQENAVPSEIEQSSPEQPELDLNMPTEGIGAEARADRGDRTVPDRDAGIESPPIPPHPAAWYAASAPVAPEPPVQLQAAGWALDEEAPPPPFVAAPFRAGSRQESANDRSADTARPDPLAQREAPFIAPRAAVEPARRNVTYAAPRPSLRRRLAPVLAMVLKHGHLIIGLVGVLLFVISVLSILTGKPSAANLAAGLVGVLCMTPTAYALLGLKTRT